MPSVEISTTDFIESKLSPIVSPTNNASANAGVNNNNTSKTQDTSSPFQTPQATSPTGYSTRLRFLDNPASATKLDQTSNYTTTGNNNIHQNSQLMQDAAKIIARKPSVFDGKGNIDDWIESMKAYFACSKPWNTTDEVIYAQVKTYMDADVVRALKHTIVGETCSWGTLKRNLELAFGRKNFHFVDLHKKFFEEKQMVDESFHHFMFKKI